MGYPFGKAPVQTGTTPTPTELPVLQGTQETDLQRVIGAQYMNRGILPNGGCKVVGTSKMAYQVASGAAFMWTDYENRLGILVPVDAGTVTTTAAPATGSRVDVVYVDAQGVTRVTTNTAPSNGLALASFVVPAGAASTKSLPDILDQTYAIPTGASLGRLARWIDPGGGASTGQEKARFAAPFTLPSDRLVRIEVSTTLKAATATPGTMQLGLDIDGRWVRWVDIAFTKDWNTTGFVYSTGCLNGPHTFTIRTRSLTGGSWKFADDAGTAPTEVALWDAGPNR